MGQRKKYDKAIKEQVVLHTLAEETIVSDKAKELGIHNSTVRECVKPINKMGQMPSHVEAWIHL